MGFFQRRKLARLVKDGNVEAVLDVLGSNDEGDRCDAACALAESNDAHAVEALINLLVDRNLSVRVAAANSLGKIGDTTCIVPLIYSIKNESLKPFMSNTEGKSIVPTKADMDAKLRLFQGHGQYMPFINAVARALINIGPSVTVPLCKFLIDDSVRIRGVVAAVLRKVGSEDAVPSLLTALSNDNEDFFIRAVLASAFDRIDKDNLFDRLMQHVSSLSLQSSRVKDLLSGLDRGSYSGIETIEQGNTNDSLMKSLEDLKKYL